KRTSCFPGLSFPLRTSRTSSGVREVPYLGAFFSLAMTMVSLRAMTSLKEVCFAFAQTGGTPKGKRPRRSMVWRERLINESSLIKNGPKGEEKRPVCLFRREKRGHAPFSVLNLKRNADPLFRPTSGLSGASLLKPWLHSCAPCLISCLGRRGSHSE